MQAVSIAYFPKFNPCGDVLPGGDASRKQSGEAI
jgi:hypothetical protein